MFEKREKNQRYIYVLLSRTHTIPATLIRLYTKEPYSHASIALDVELKELYSFARKHRFNPFDSGFVEEDLERGIFGADKSICCRVYEIPVTEEQYGYIREEISHFIKNQEDYGYNYIGLFGGMFGKNHEDKTHFLCSQFVSHVLYRGGIKLFSKESGLIRPFDFHLKLRDKQIYEGRLSKYRDFLKKSNRLKTLHGEDVFREAM